MAISYALIDCLPASFSFSSIRFRRSPIGPTASRAALKAVSRSGEAPPRSLPPAVSRRPKAYPGPARHRSSTEVHEMREPEGRVQSRCVLCRSPRHIAVGGQNYISQWPRYGGKGDPVFRPPAPPGRTLLIFPKSAIRKKARMSVGGVGVDLDCTSVFGLSLCPVPVQHRNPC